MGVEETRIRTLRKVRAGDAGSHALYWTQQSQRAAHNPALEHAVKHAREVDVRRFAPPEEQLLCQKTRGRVAPPLVIG